MNLDSVVWNWVIDVSTWLTMQSYEAFQPTANFLSKIVILQHSCDRIITIAVTTPSHHVIYIAFIFSESPRQPCRGCIIIQKIEKSPALQLSVMVVKSSKSELWYSFYKVGKAILWESDTMNRWKLTFPQMLKNINILRNPLKIWN